MLLGTAFNIELNMARALDPLQGKFVPRLIRTATLVQPDILKATCADMNSPSTLQSSATNHNTHLYQRYQSKFTKSINREK